MHLFSLISLLITLLAARTEGNTCYLPNPNHQSNCCAQCKAYGCIVNAGKVDSNTPCNPNAPWPIATWMYCDSYACGGGCGNCRCERMNLAQWSAVYTDLKSDSLFYAFKKIDLTITHTKCNDCGNKDPKKSLLTSDVLCTGTCGSSTKCGSLVPVGAPSYSADWLNDWDRPFRFYARGKPFCAMKSIHHNRHEDRRFNLGVCSVGKQVTGYHYLSYTDWDATWTRNCPYGYFLRYVYSVHSNSKEDRRFRFGCMKFKKTTWRTCYGSSYVNRWDQDIDYKCPANTVMTGISSYHANSREDRRFSFRCCSLTTW